MTKQTPVRMCAACRAEKPKNELIRVVRTSDGTVTLDRTGKANGRGAYLCRDAACLAKARKSRALERALGAVPDGLFSELEGVLNE